MDVESNSRLRTGQHETITAAANQKLIGGGSRLKTERKIEQGSSGRRVGFLIMVTTIGEVAGGILCVSWSGYDWNDLTRRFAQKKQRQKCKQEKSGSWLSAREKVLRHHRPNPNSAFSAKLTANKKPSTVNCLLNCAGLISNSRILTTHRLRRQ